MYNRKNLVAEHALALFVENGVRNTSIQHIIKRAGISKGTFYNYFSSKTECIEEILEQSRYDAALMRAELMIGKDARDINVLVNQIGVLSQINRKRGLDIVFEELLHSGEQELKDLVIRQRLSELEWFSSRLIEIFGEEVRVHAFEASILFYGMTQHLLFITKMINQQTIQSEDVSKQTLHYLLGIIESLVNKNTAILDHEKLNAFRNLFSAKIAIPFEEINEKLQAIANSQLHHAQKQIVDAVIEEFTLETPRPIVMNALLKSFIDQFENSELYQEVKIISSYIWHSIQRQ